MTATSRSAFPAAFARGLVVVLCLALASCGYNNIPTLEEQAKAKWPRSRTTISAVPT